MSTELVLAVFGLSGIAAGFFAGLFGIGGGLIMVPVLVYAFGPKEAVPIMAIAAVLANLSRVAVGVHRTR